MMERYTMRMLRRCFCTLDPKRLQYIRNHTPMTEYEVGRRAILEVEPDSHRACAESGTDSGRSGDKVAFFDRGRWVSWLFGRGYDEWEDLGICMKVGTQDETPENAGSLQYLKNFVHMKPTFE